MSFAAGLSLYLTLNLLVGVATLALRAVRGRSSARSELRLHYLAFATLFLVTAAGAFVPRPALFEPVAKVWSAHPYREVTKASGPRAESGVLAIPTPRGHSRLNAENVSAGFFLVAILLAAFGAFRIGRDGLRMLALRRDSYRVRRIGRVSVLVSERVSVPFSYWVPGRADVVLPSALTARPLDLRMAIAHELQHHRQRDTVWVYAMEILVAVCFPNPFAHLWRRLLSEVQEFAVDETLVDRNKVESRQYARCLLEVAETALRPKPNLACATGMTFRTERHLLTRRVEKMISIQSKKRSAGAWVSGGLVALMAVSAWASQGLVQDRRVSRVEAEKWAERARDGSGFPIVVNDLVLEQLNRYAGTPEGRDVMQKALARMEDYRPVIEAKMREYRVPAELLAVPIVESGYQNLNIRTDKQWVAGIWMFIAETARTYGLRVDDRVDERMNSELLTDAALRYLKADRLRFNDWLLAILSYNVGERALTEAMRKTGSRDAWTLIRSGLKTDKDYLPRVMAAVLILKNPEALN